MGKIKFNPVEYIKVVDGVYKGHYGFICPGDYPTRKKVWLITRDDLVTFEENEHIEIIPEAEYIVAQIMIL